MDGTDGEKLKRNEFNRICMDESVQTNQVLGDSLAEISFMQ